MSFNIQENLARGSFAVVMIGAITCAVATTYCGWSERAKSAKRFQEEYDKSQQTIEATVLDEVYENRLESVPERHVDGLVSQAYSNETVKLNSRYTLRIKTRDGKTMGLSVVDGGGSKKEALDLIVNKSSRISFPKGNLISPGRHDPRETYISEDSQIATKRADRINVLPQE